MRWLNDGLSVYSSDFITLSTTTGFGIYLHERASARCVMPSVIEFFHLQDAIGTEKNWDMNLYPLGHNLTTLYGKLISQN